MLKRLRISVGGFVQGVGFRPFIYRIATELRLSGFVRNVIQGVIIEVEGEEKQLRDFLRRLKWENPPAAEIHEVGVEELKPTSGDSKFEIISSLKEDKRIGLIPPDIATCQDCLRELFDPSDRRFLYPFINCTNCGPRFTIIRELPYDRVRTTMESFKMCEKCQDEYENPLNRRFHAQPNACFECGPSYTLIDSNGKPISGEPVKTACELIKAGEIVAVKGIGGFLLMADATSDKVVARLRKLKRRKYKPFALMVSDIEAVKRIAELDSNAGELLSSPIAPILLLPLKKEKRKHISALIAPNLNRIGVMLPYAPIHHIIMREGEFNYIVATSGNRSDEPIARDNQEALDTLGGIASYFLIHNRDIYNRVDDSVVKWTGMGAMVLRRARGYVPRPLSFPISDKVVLGVGADLKSTFTVVRDGYAFTSQHIGELEYAKSEGFYKETLEKFYRWLECKEAEVIVSDLHPDYISSRIAEKLAGRLLRVQHHYAHALSVVAEHRLFDKKAFPLLGVVYDGYGYGSDGGRWGGEFILFDLHSFKRVASLLPFKPLGRIASYPPLSALSFILSAGLEPPTGRFERVEDHRKHFKHITTYSTSVGRLFDAVTALLGICSENTYEGEAPQRLEALVRPELAGNEGLFSILECGQSGMLYIDWRECLKEFLREGELTDLATSFHWQLSGITVKLVMRLKERYSFGGVVLSGGCFQNDYLLSWTVAGLKEKGIDVYYNINYPANDGGISLGQALYGIANGG